MKRNRNTTRRFKAKVALAPVKGSAAIPADVFDLLCRKIDLVYLDPPDGVTT